MTATGLITVWLDVDARHESEFNDWYVGEHIPEVVGLEGFVVGRRYHCPTSELRYLAWYETVDEHVEPGPHFQRLVANPTPWSQRIRRLYGDRRERLNFRLATHAGAEPVSDLPWLWLLQFDVPERGARAFAHACASDLLPWLAGRSGSARVRHYEAVTGAPRHMIAVETDQPDALPDLADHGVVIPEAIAPPLRTCVQLHCRTCRLILPSVHRRDLAD